MNDYSLQLPTIKETLKKNKVKNNKSLGQNFLFDLNLLSLLCMLRLLLGLVPFPIFYWDCLLLLKEPLKEHHPANL